MRYCCKQHQIADWHIHKLLCKKFADFQERPGEGFHRAILFPQGCKKPCFVWALDPVEPASLEDDDDWQNGAFASSENEQDESCSIIDYEGDEMGWEEARANPTGYEIPDAHLFDGWSDESPSTGAISVEDDDDEQGTQGTGLALRSSYKDPTEDKPNKCIASLVNDRAAARFRGSWELYGMDRATRSPVDLDTTVLSLALLMIDDQVLHEACLEEPGEEVVAGSEPAVKELEDFVLLGGQDVDIEASLESLSLLEPSQD